MTFLSTGETTLVKHLGDAGKRARIAEQGLRLLNIDADAGVGLGLFGQTHGRTPGAFASALVTACAHHHGTAGPAFVERLVADTDGTCETIARTRQAFGETFGLDDADGQVQRAAHRFALIAAAGELATEYGLTGWSEGDATAAAGVCFRSWRTSWTPSGTHEAERAIEAVVSFLQTQASRSQSRDHDTERHPIRDRFGFVEWAVVLAEPDPYARDMLFDDTGPLPSLSRLQRQRQHPRTARGRRHGAQARTALPRSTALYRWTGRSRSGRATDDPPAPRTIDPFGQAVANHPDDIADAPPKAGAWSAARLAPMPPCPNAHTTTHPVLWRSAYASDPTARAVRW